MNKLWHGLLKIIEIEYLDKNKKILWRAENLLNTFHYEGENFILNAVFAGGKIDNLYIPENYYFGLDGRTTITAADTMSTIEDSGNEPNINGYSRIAVSSYNEFETALVGDRYRAVGPILSYAATGGSYGPVRNLFLTNKIDNTGSLIASVPLTNPITLSNNQVINCRMALSFADC